MTVSYVKMGNSDLTFSRIIPGLMRLLEWKLSKEELSRWIHVCYEMGITTFDHADIYGSYRCEEVFGEALALTPSLRNKFQFVTKCGIALVSPNRPDHTIRHFITSKEHIIASAERSLRNLHTDHLDVLLIHRPDPLMNADDVAAALIELKKSGKVLYFGVSNFLPFHFDLLQSRLDFPLVTNQIEFSVTHTEPFYDGSLDQAQRLRLPPMIWSPVGGGKLFTSDDERSVRVRSALQKVADEIDGASLDQIALAWTMQHPAKPLPVLGTGKLERIKAAIDAEDIQLTRQQWFTIREASAGPEIP
ncbi:MAG TPA: aldo/keto reductase [Phototrophicaceae bacterium]|jgi:predicted oxidoreductase|nr:aldo/keto reductase [Phototrophicaceae bacterium]